MRRGHGKVRRRSRAPSRTRQTCRTPQQLISQQDQVQDDQVKEAQVKDDQVEEDDIMELDKSELTEDHLGDDDEDVQEKVEKEDDDNSSLVKAKPCHPALTNLIGTARTQGPDICCPTGMKKSRSSAPPNSDKRQESQEIKTEPGTQKTLKSRKELEPKLETATRSGRIVHPRNLFMTSVYSTPQQRRSLQFPPLGEAASTGATTTGGFKGFSDSWRDNVLRKRLKKEEVEVEGEERPTANIVHKCIRCKKGFPGFKELHCHVTDRSSPCRFNRSLWTDKKSNLIVKKYKTENNDNQEYSRPLVNEIPSPDSPDIEETNQKIASTESEVTKVTEESHKPQHQAEHDQDNQEQQQEEKELQEQKVTELGGPRRTDSMESQQTEPIDIDNEFPLMSPQSQSQSQPSTSFSSPIEDEHNEQDDKIESKNSADMPDVEETDEGKQKRQESQENLQMDANDVDDVNPTLHEVWVPHFCIRNYSDSASVHAELVEVRVVPYDDEMNDSLASLAIGPDSSADTTSSVSIVSMSPRPATDAEDEDDEDCAIIEEISEEEVSNEELKVVGISGEEDEIDDSMGAGDQFLFHLNFDIDFDEGSQNDSASTGNTSEDGEETSEMLDCEPPQKNKYNEEEDDEKMRFEEDDHLNSMMIPDPGAIGPAPVRPDVVPLLPINDGKHELPIPNESEENHHEKEEGINSLLELLDQPGPETPSENASGTSGANSGSDMDKQSKPPTKVVQSVQPQRRSERKRKAKVIQDADGTGTAALPTQRPSKAKGKGKEITKQVVLGFCPICGLDVPADELEDHKRNHEMECDICGRDDLRINEEFAAHGATHVGDLLDCQEEGCGYAAFNRRDLWHHANKEHRKTNPWICLKCGWAFPTAPMYKLHTKGSYHPGHTPFAKSP